MNESKNYVPPQVLTLEADKIIASLGPALARGSGRSTGTGTTRTGGGWDGGCGTPMGDSSC